MLKNIFFSFLVLLFGLLQGCNTDPDTNCWDTCEAPRRCQSNECKCTSGRVFIGRMCLAPSEGQYIAYLPEEDFLDTFALNVGPGGSYKIRLQSNSDGGHGGQGYLTSYATLDSLYIPQMLAPASQGGWPDTLNGKTFIFDFHAAIHHDSRDTLFAKLRWIGIGSGTDLQPPVEFMMFLVKGE